MNAINDAALEVAKSAKGTLAEYRIFPGDILVVYLTDGRKIKRQILNVILEGSAPKEPSKSKSSHPAR